MRILAIISGEYGRRHVENIRTHRLDVWEIETWNSPAVLPPVIDYPEDYLPESFKPADLILSFAEHKGVAELLPDIAEMTGASGVVVAVDNEAWLPRGLARQLHEWLDRIGVACATPKPLCSLTARDFGVTRRQRQPYESPVISEFASFFGKPELEITVDEKTRTIKSADVRRDAVCGCTRYVAEGIVGISVDDVEEKAGLLHHHYPCLASMVKLDDFNHDTLMHESGHILVNNIRDQIKPYKSTRYISPGNRSD
jgi:thymidylate synthase